MDSSRLLSNKAQVFRRALENPLQAYERLQNDKDMPVVGYFTDLVPIELIHAAGGHPGRLFPSPKSDEPLDSLVQTFCCSYLRNFLSSILETDLKKSLSLIIYTNNFCDSLTNVMDIFEHAFPEFPFAILNQPVASNSSNIESFFTAELHHLLKKIARITGKLPDEKNIRDSMTIYEEIRKSQSDLETLYLKNYDQIAFSDLIACFSGRELFPTAEYQDALNGILEELKNIEKKDNSDCPRLVVVGGMFHDLETFDVIERAGSSIVGELLLFGHKDNIMRFDGSKSAIGSLADAYLAKIPAATRYDLYRKTNALLGMVQKRNADGVIHLNWKFCDPDAFEAVMIKSALETARIPFLMLESDPQRSNLEQLKTRCQAFCEMLEEN
ncbi:MAG: 2-hydroxyacyl-CoA dehydratase subunit D [Candidatus Hodarchaeota archaeon]